MKRLTRLTLIAAMLTIASAAVVTSFPTVAVAQDTESKLEGMLQQATDDYDMLMVGEAKKKLQDAIALAEREGITGPVVARLHVMFGIASFAESRDEATAKQAFVSALENDYDVAIPSAYQNPELTKIMQNARQEVPEPAPESGGQTQGGQTDGGQVPTDGFEHDPIQTAKAGQPLEVEAFVPADMPVYRVFVYHRRFGEKDFTKTEMNPTSATRFAVDLPGDVVRTSQVDYYLEAIDRAGDVLARSGAPTSPLSIAVLGSSDADGPGGGDTGDPGGGPGGETPRVDGPRADQKVYVMLAGGTGLGFLTGGQPTAHPDRNVSPGVAPAFGHAMLDAGYMISENAHIGMYFRYQFTPPQDFSAIPPESKEAKSFFNTEEECLGLGLPGDCLLGFKYRWFFKDIDRFRMYSSTGAGIGRIRSWLRLQEPYYTDGNSEQTSAECQGKDVVEDPVAGDVCYVRDTVRPGWAHFGVGAGAMWPLHTNVDLMADSYLIVLLPETGINFDINVGVNVRF